MTIAEIRAKYPEEKRRLDRSNPACYFVHRPISFYITWLFLRLGISANKTTLMGLFAGVIGYAFLAIGNYWAIITGAILVYVYVLFDNTDGNIARVTGSASRMGDYLDKLAGYIMTLLMPIAIGIGLYWHPDPHLNYLTHLLFETEINNNIVYLIIGLSYSLLRTFRFIISQEFGLTFSVKPQDSYRPKAEAGKSLWKFFYTIGVKLLVLIWPVFLVSAISNVLSIFITFYTVLALTELITVAARTLVVASKIERTTNK